MFSLAACSTQSGPARIPKKRSPERVNIQVYEPRATEEAVVVAVVEPVLVMELVAVVAVSVAVLLWEELAVLSRLLVPELVRVLEALEDRVEVRVVLGLVLLAVDVSEDVADVDTVKEFVDVTVVVGDVCSQREALRPSFKVEMARFR